jgi:hypothetical protein
VLGAVIEQLPPELFRRGRGTPAPRMSADRAAFFPTVLRNDIFGRDGLLFGFERVAGLPVHWAVIDPGRHSMYVWRKQQISYPRSAMDLGASLFSNGPFSDYGSGTLLRSAAHFSVDAAQSAYRAVAARTRAHNHRGLSGLSVEHFQAPAPLGFVVGARERISETAHSRPNVFHFGRGEGTEFENYRIARGDPVGLTEAIGGLFGGVSDYRPYTVNRLIRVGYWCTVPLTCDETLHLAGIDASIRVYHQRSGRVCDGVLLVVAGWANTQRLTHLLSAIRVKDAVQIDGGDSLLLGGGRTLRQGTFMPEWKRLLQCWGIQFRSTDTD